MKKFILKPVSIIMIAVLLLTAISTAGAVSTTSASSGNVVYPNGIIKLNFTFAKDIPVGVPCYLFELNYDPSSLEYKALETDFLPHSLVVPHPDEDDRFISWSAFTDIGPSVKAGEKLASLVFDVTKQVNVDELDFSFIEFQLYDNNLDKSLDKSYLISDIEIVSYGDIPNKAQIGDVDMSGKISVIDATTVQKHLAVLIDLTPEQLKIADCNGDKLVSIVDVTLIQKYLVDNPDTGNVGKYI